MKKHNLAEFFKSKSFYVLLSVGALAIVVITMVGLLQSSGNGDNNNLVDLNEPISELTDDDKNQEIETEPDDNNEAPSSVTNNDDGDDETEIAQGDTNDPVTELEGDAYGEPNSTVDAETDEEVYEPEEVEQVMKPETLHFNPENDKLLWPVSGNVILKYSMDSLVFFNTLQQYKVNPAMLIQAELGEEVTSAADSVITSVKEDDETGLTVTASLGDGYSIVYGQLDGLTVEEGDRVEKGQILGSVKKPTKYYSVEGPNLYFQLLKEEKTLDPMLVLE